MFTNIYFISNIVNWIANLLALAAALLYCFKSFNPPYLRVFPFYLFVSIGIEALVNPYMNKWLDYQPFSTRQPYIMNVFYNLFTPFELFVFAYFLFQVIQSPAIKRILLTLICLFTIF